MHDLNGINRLNTAKAGILADLEHIQGRCSKALQGSTKFLDARVRTVTQAIKHIEQARSLLAVGLVPTNTE